MLPQSRFDGLLQKAGIKRLFGAENSRLIEEVSQAVYKALSCFLKIGFFLCVCDLFLIMYLYACGFP